MQNAIPVDHNNCALSEAKSVTAPTAQTKAGDAKPSDMPSMPSVSANTAHHNHNQLVNSVANNAANSCHKNINSNTNCSSPKLNLMAELFESEEEDDDNSEVESFTLDEEPVLDTSKFLLSAETSDNKLVSGINLRDTPEIDAESRANLEALLDADKHLIDPDVLRRIASSFAVSDVHCALDEAAAAIAKMRISDSQLSSLSTTTLQKADPSQDLSTNIDASSRLTDDRCSVNEVTEEGESFLSFACSSGHYELAKQLLAARANVEDRGLKDTTPLMEACSAGHFRIVELLIENNAEVNAQTSQGNTPLMYACAGGHEDVVKLLLKNGANVEDHNENGHTPLMEAASAGHVGVASILVEHGASINTHSNEFKESALTLACYKGHLEMVRFLLEAGADQEHKTDEMHTALMEASMDGHVEVARLLLDSGAQVNMPADSFESPLTLAACGGHVELAMLLLERGANIEEVNDEGYTPLMEAAREGHEEMVALLLSQGADINAQTEETQETALTLACCGGFLDVADFLIKAGADIEAGANTPLMEAAQEGHLDLVRHLINCGANVNATTSSGDTALMYACENGHTDVAELLLQAGADLEHEAEGGRTSLMKASRAGHLCTVQFLINKGANVNKVTANNDHTALSLACAGGHLAVVELLLANSADPTHRLKDSSTMLIEAAKGGHTTVVQLLIDYPNNLMSSSSPVLPSHLTSSSTDTDVTPRVPPHGLQLEDTSNRTQSSISSLQSKINIQKSISKKNSSKESASTTKTNVVTNRASDCVDSSFVPISKHRVGNKVLERSLSDSGTSFIAPSNIGITESTTFSSIDALKEAERLEARINDMIRRTDELDPAKEEQIRQKQQILEELQRVEREYQAHWQQQLIQCYQAGLSCGPALSQVSPNIPVDNSASNISSQGIPVCLDVQNLQKPTKSEPSFQMPSSITQSNIFQPTSTSVTSDLSSLNLSVITTQNACTNTVSTSTNTTLSLSTIPPNRRFRSNSKIKSMSSKHSHQPNVAKSTASHSAEEVKNSINLEHLDSNIQTSVSQQTQNLLQQQQMILSELAQNFSSRPETLQFLQAAASNMKIDASIPFLLPRLFEPNTLNQSSVIQSPNQSQTTSQSVSQTSQSLNVSNETAKKSLQTSVKSSKGAKSAKVVNCLNASQSQLPTTAPTPVTTSQHTNQMTQTASLLQTLTNEQLTLLKNQFTAAASTATQTDSPSTLQPLSTSSITTPTVISQTPYSSATTGSIYSMGAPAFPVSLTLTPVAISPPTTTSNRTAIISTIIPYPVDEDNTQIVVSNPESTDINLVSSAPQISNTLISSGIDTSSGLTSILSNSFNPNINFDSSSFTNVSTVLTASMSQPVNTGFPSLSPHISHSPIDSFVANPILTKNENTESISEPIKLDSIATTLTTTTTPPSNLRIPSPPPWYPPIDLDSQTDSNHDTALTLACAGGHEELVSLLLNRGAEMEHRDKKGFTPLMLASTAGHSNVVEILLNNGSDMEAQSERTKDTALSLACSSGRYEVVEILLSRGANKEHRNVSDYTPLSLAASGGYVNIIKLLLSHGAEINSRTGSKLGISPLMLAAMNGHTTTVRLLLDMGSDINAQIETNRNTALTLACFQGRCEVVGLLLDRKANVEHRAKTGLTPLMEAASGGYVEVGRVLLDKGADVNAPPVPSSRDTALTIAADKGHYRFVELLLSRGAAVDVKNKKGNSPLWLACNGGHLDVVQLLVNAGCDIDSQDNRKVSCLMAAFRKGHVKVVKWMVKHVNQFPSDQEITRFIALINDKELLKKTNQCAEILRQAKERQAAEANKNASILLEEIDLEQKREENRKAAAARRRERKRMKKKEKQELSKATKNGPNDDKENKKISKGKDSFNRYLDEDDDDEEDDEDDDNEDSNIEEEEEEPIDIPVPQIRDISVTQKELKAKNTQSVRVPIEEPLKEIEKPKKSPIVSNITIQSNITKKTNQRTKDVKSKKKEESIANEVESIQEKSAVKTINTNVLHKNIAKNVETDVRNDQNKRSSDFFGELIVQTSKDMNGSSLLSSANNRSPGHYASSSAKSVISIGGTQTTQNSSKKGSKREEGWKEVVRKSKKVVVPSNAISRVIGRGGCNINTIREISGAHIEVEKQKGQGDRNVIIKGSADATRHAQQLITALSKETEKELSEIIKSLGLSRPTSVSSDEIVGARNPCKSQSTAAMSSTSRQLLSTSNVQKSSSMGSVGTSGMITSAFSNRSTLLVRTSAPMAHSSPFINAWTNKTSTSKMTSSCSQSSPVNTKSVVSYTMAVAAKGKNTKTTSVSSIVSTVPKVITTCEMKTPSNPMANTLRSTGAPQGIQPFNQVFTGARVPVPNSSTGVKSNSFLPSAKQPFNLQTPITTQQLQTSVTPTSGVGDMEQKPISSASLNGSTPEYTPFNNLFSKVAQQSVWGQSKEKPNFASVAASGLTTMTSNNAMHSPGLSTGMGLPGNQSATQELSIDASKAPGYRGNLHISPSNASMASTPPSSNGSSNLGPIGSGHARSAPCTPPLMTCQGPLTPSNSAKISSPPLSETPSSPGHHSLMTEQQTSLYSLNNDNNSSPMNRSDSPSHSLSNAPVSSSPVATTYHQMIQSNVINSSNMSPVVSNTMKSQNYGISSSSMNVSQRQHYMTNSTLGQSSPHASVGSVVSMQNIADQSQAMFVSPNSNVVQSNLNPNAPDFSARGLQTSHQMNGPSTIPQNRMTMNSGSNLTQNQTIILQDQMRAAILAASANLQLQTLQKQQAARMQMVANPGLHPNVHLAGNDFGGNTPPPSPETLRLLHTAINSIPNPNSVHGLNYGLMQTSNYMPQQFPHQRMTSASNVRKDIETTVDRLDYEERKQLPRPIGTERAQRKNPNPVYSHNLNAINEQPVGMWPLGEVMANDMQEWMQTTPQMTNSSNIMNDNSMSNINQNRFNSSEDISHFDASYSQMNMGSHAANPINFTGMPVMGVNGVPPHLSPAIYQSVSANSAISGTQEDYWTNKMGRLSANNDQTSSQSANTDHKMNWNHWNHQS